MYRMFVVASLAACGAVANAQTPGAAQTAVVAAVHQFVDGFNKGGMKIMAASCAEQASILDEFPPHEWHGAGACAKWAGDYDADAKKNGITDGVVTLSTPTHVDGSIITLALQKSPARWHITGWA